MKNLLLFILVITCFQSAFSQTDDWFEYKIDSNFSVKFPWEEDTYGMDSIINNSPCHFVFSDFGFSNFVVIKALIEDENISVFSTKLPNNESELEEFYRGVKDGFNDETPYTLTGNEKIDFLGFNGILLKYSDESEQQIMEVKAVIIERYLYTFMYFNENGLDDNLTKSFFNSISIDDSSNLSQYLGKPRSYKVGYMVGRVSIFIIIIVLCIVFYNKRKKKKLLEKM